MILVGVLVCAAVLMTIIIVIGLIVCKKPKKVVFKPKNVVPKPKNVVMPPKKEDNVKLVVVRPK